MKIIGLTGGIGSGKSTAAQFLKALGAAVIDLDKVGHEVYKKGGGVYPQLLNAFGEGILAADGEIDRTRLGKIVFGSPEALKRLNSIVHPAIDKIVDKATGENRRKGVEVMVLEAAAMLEAERAWQVDEIWVIAAPETAVIQRIKGRSNYNEEVARERIKSQMTNGERFKKANVVIMNDGTPEALKEKVKVEWDNLLKRL